MSIGFSELDKNATNSSNSEIIYFHNLGMAEKVDTLKFANKNSNKIIIELTTYSLEVEKIINFKEDSVVVELLDDWWWNKPKQPVFHNRSPIETPFEGDRASYNRVIPIEDIQAIHIVKKKPLIILLMPAILVVLIMKSFGL